MSQQEAVEVVCADGTLARFVYQDGRVVEAANDVCAVRFDYDAAGRMIKEESGGRTVEFRRNQAGALIGLVTPDGAQLGFERDAEQRIVRLQDWQGNTLHFSYAPSGALQRLDYPNGVAAEFTANAMGFPTSMRLHAAGGARLISEVSWDSDLCDRVEAQTVDGQRFAYGYDPAGRLVHENGAAYTLDANGNRIAGPEGTSTFDAANQIETWAGQAIAHDARGNMVAGPCPKGSAQLTYDGLDRLQSVYTSGGVARYFYDALGRRVRKEFAGLVTRYTWAGDLLLSEETEQDGVVTRRDYLHFPDTKMPLAMRVGGACRYLHPGRRGETLAMTGAGGEVLWQALYTAFGEIRIVQARESQPWRLLGQYGDDETGLHYVLARYYHPQLGRFLTPDPQGISGGSLNLYTYCDGDPVNAVDPTGELAFLAVVGIIAVR